MVKRVGSCIEFRKEDGRGIAEQMFYPSQTCPKITRMDIYDYGVMGIYVISSPDYYNLPDILVTDVLFFILFI